MEEESGSVKVHEEVCAAKISISRNVAPGGLLDDEFSSRSGSRLIYSDGVVPECERGHERERGVHRSDQTDQSPIVERGHALVQQARGSPRLFRIHKRVHVEGNIVFLLEPRNCWVVEILPNLLQMRRWRFIAWAQNVVLKNKLNRLSMHPSRRIRHIRRQRSHCVLGKTKKKGGSVSFSFFMPQNAFLDKR